MTAAIVGLLVAAAALLWPSRAGRASAGWPAGRAPGSRGVSRGARSWVAPSRAHASATWPWGRRRRDDEAVSAEVLELLDGIGPALRAGLPPAAALRAVATASHQGGDLTVALLQAAERGARLGPVWRTCAGGSRSGSGPRTRRHGDEPTDGGDGLTVGRHAGLDDVALVAAAWSLSESLGTPLAAAVTAAADLVRRRRLVRSRIEVAVAGPKATMRVLLCLPLAGPVVGLALGLSPGQLYAGPAGVGALLAGGVLLLVGRWWCRRLVRAVLREDAGAG